MSWAGSRSSGPVDFFSKTYMQIEVLNSDCRVGEKNHRETHMGKESISLSGLQQLVQTCPSMLSSRLLLYFPPRTGGPPSKQEVSPGLFLAQLLVRKPYGLFFFFNVCSVEEEDDSKKKGTQRCD